jgi:1,4-alpha-glucan branching enzyme
MSPTQTVTVTPKAGGTRFCCHAADAKSVFLAGSFNDWSTSATPMARNGHNQWKASLPLARGRYEYKFVVDGEWCCEPGCVDKDVHCPYCIVNEFGTMNRVLEVEQKR